MEQLVAMCPYRCRVGDALGNTTSYRYDVTGALTRVSGPEPGLQRTWVIGVKGLPDSETQPESGTTTYTYDQSGNVKTVTDANGQTTTLSYDENGRLTLRDAPGPDDDLAVTYDTTGRVWTLSSGVSPTISTTTFTYDVPNRTVTKSDFRQSGTFDATFHSVYISDANDNLQFLAYPSGRVVTYYYDGENRMTSIDQTPPGANSFPQVFAHDFVYGDRGQLDSYITGAVTQRFAIEFNRPTRIWTTGGAGALDLTYGYDNVGNVNAIADPRPGASQAFTLDPLDRLSTANGPWGTLAWTYDAAGNRRTESAPALTTYNYAAATRGGARGSGDSHPPARWRPARGRSRSARRTASHR